MSTDKILIIANNGIDLHIANESFEAVCTAMSKKHASDIKSAYNGTYGAGINPEAVQDLYDALERMIDMGGYCPHGADSLESGFPERFERAKAAIEKATINS